MDQALGLLRLQMLLTWRSWTRGRTLAAAASGALFLIAGTGVAAASIALYFFAAEGMKNERTYAWLLVFDAMICVYVFFWVWSFLLDLQRHDVFDLRRLLHLPVSPALVFGMNFVASLLSPVLFIGLPVSSALLLGASRAHGPEVLLGFAHLGAFFLALGAWQYHLRGWFSMLMENQRRRRLLITVIAAGFVILAQVPWIVSYNTNDDTKDWVEFLIEEESLEPYVREINAILPPGWLALGGVALIEGDTVTAGWTLAALSALGLVGLGWGYRSTVRHYLGKQAHGAARKTATGRRRPLTGLALPPSPKKRPHSPTPSF